jgi:hypothetical protein
MPSKAGKSHGGKRPRREIALEQLRALNNLTPHPQMLQDLSKLREKPSVFWHEEPVPQQGWENLAGLAFDKIKENKESNTISYTFSSTVIFYTFSSTVIFMLGQKFLQKYDLKRLSGRALEDLVRLAGQTAQLVENKVKKLYSDGSKWNAYGVEKGYGSFFFVPRLSLRS